MNATDQPPPDDYDRRQWTNLLVLGVAILLVVTMVLMLMLKHGIELQDCFAAGHHNCAPIDTSQGRE
jgi:hypothetical protein